MYVRAKVHITIETTKLFLLFMLEIFVDSKSFRIFALETEHL